MTTRRGFTLVEILVGITLLSTVLIFVAGLQTVQSRLTWRATLTQRANAVLLQRVELYEGLHWAQMPVGGGCTYDTLSARGTLRFFRCDTIAAPPASFGTQKSIEINVLAPLDQRSTVSPEAVAADSVRTRFVRARARVQRFLPPGAPF